MFEDVSNKRLVGVCHWVFLINQYLLILYGIKILSDIIGEENKRRPLSDEKLKSLLLKKGYNIARRTVAKYREQLNIPVARLRKGL